ncbi:hypothetical protein SCLCIDRAFT_235911 [Scleroderma citrinum Foug A]|uniref:Uncharacterized protein n=1 Tax=Scleroderma citrinum Foug A TaxID=1036808 RepID=A0A0C2ZVX8_9AGAM|nr:hypothetical protein SCLCIDRAFT_235911 [Scleroderma citrinum Foug A]
MSVPNKWLCNVVEAPIPYRYFVLPWGDVRLEVSKEVSFTAEVHGVRKVTIVPQLFS